MGLFFPFSFPPPPPPPPLSLTHKGRNKKNSYTLRRWFYLLWGGWAGRGEERGFSAFLLFLAGVVGGREEGEYANLIAVS